MSPRRSGEGARLASELTTSRARAARVAARAATDAVSRHGGLAVAPLEGDLGAVDLLRGAQWMAGVRAPRSWSSRRSCARASQALKAELREDRPRLEGGAARGPGVRRGDWPAVSGALADFKAKDQGKVLPWQTSRQRTRARFCPGRLQGKGPGQGFALANFKAKDQGKVLPWQTSRQRTRARFCPGRLQGRGGRGPCLQGNALIPAIPGALAGGGETQFALANFRAEEAEDLHVFRSSGSAGEGTGPRDRRWSCSWGQTNGPKGRSATAPRA